MTSRCVKCGEPLLGSVNRCWRCGTEILDAVAAEPPLAASARAAAAPEALTAVPVRRVLGSARPATPHQAAAAACAWAGLGLGVLAIVIGRISPVSAMGLGLIGLALSLSGFYSRRWRLPAAATVVCLVALLLRGLPALADTYELIYGEKLFAPAKAEEEDELDELLNE